VRFFNIPCELNYFIKIRLLSGNIRFPICTKKSQLESLQNQLKNSSLKLHIWAFIAAFGAYFCTYAFRKPFSTGVFEGIEIYSINAKTVFILSQVIGYMLSKFIGIKVISELTSGTRIKLIIALIVISEVALFLFGILPLKYKFIGMFINGLPLGMVYGVIFSFLEGRRFTEFLGLGLSINMIMTSGILKSLYLWIQSFTNMSEFGMPAFIGLIFLPLLLFFLWMLGNIPRPSQTEQNLKKKREAMNRRDKNEILKNYGLGVTLIVIFYAFLTTIRDFRDNFSIEIWHSVQANHEISVFAKTEIWISVWVFLSILFLNIFKNNKKALIAINLIFILCLILISFANNQMALDKITGSTWMILQGFAFYLPYLIIQIAFFDRLIPLLNIRGNAGFFIYICDSFGYLGSVVLMILKEFWDPMKDPKIILIELSNGVAIIGILVVVGQFLFFEVKRKRQNISENINLEIVH